MSGRAAEHTAVPTPNENADFIDRLLEVLTEFHDDERGQLELCATQLRAHDSLLAANARLRQALEAAESDARTQLYSLCMSAADDFAGSARKDELSSLIGRYRAALATPKEGK